MTAYFTKSVPEIMNNVLQKLTTTTPLTATSPGSVLRALVEGITNEIGNLYSALDFNMSLKAISTAQGLALDYIGQLYNVPRKTLTDIATVDSTLGIFYFYIDQPFPSDILVPVGTRVFTNIDTYIGQQYSYATTSTTALLAGRTRAYASIRPLNVNSVFTAGPGTLTVLDPSFIQPNGTTLKCTNPKPITAQIGYESDDLYRARIVAATQTSAGGTLPAIRNTALSVNGVRDATVFGAQYGMGSFDVVVVPEDNRLAPQILHDVLNALSAVKPVGVAMNIRQPVVLPLSVQASIVLSQTANVDSTVAIAKVQVAIVRYLNSLLVGTTFVYNQLVQAIMDSVDVISDVSITSLSANGTEILRQNYTPNSDEQVIPGEILVTVANS